MSFQTCSKCKTFFRGDGNSPWCLKCKEDMEWGAHKNQSKNVEKPKEKSTEDFGKIQSGEPESLQKEKKTEPRISQQSAKEVGNIILKIENASIEKESNGLVEIRKDKMLTAENTTQETRSIFIRSSTEVVPEETQSQDSSANSIDLSREISHSVNSLNELGKELFSSMKGLRSDLPDKAVRLYDPERVTTAVQCSHQIVSVVKAKLELLKFAKEIK